MRPQIFEFSKKYGLSQVTFFRKVKETNIHSESFLEFWFYTFWHNNRSFFEIKIFFWILWLKSIFVGHIFSLWPINGKHLIFLLWKIVIFITCYLITEKYVIYLLWKIENFEKMLKIERTLRVRKNWIKHFHQKPKSGFSISYYGLSK